MYLKYAVSALLATVVLARPSNWNDDGWDDDTPDCPDTPDNCLTDSDAADIITVYETLISRKITGAEFNETADSILAPTFFTQSNSLNAEIRKPVSTNSSTSPKTISLTESSSKQYPSHRQKLSKPSSPCNHHPRAPPRLTCSTLATRLPGAGWESHLKGCLFEASL